MVYHTWRLSLQATDSALFKHTDPSAPNTTLTHTIGFVRGASSITSLISPAPCNVSDNDSASQNNCTEVFPWVMNWFDNHF